MRLDLPATPLSLERVRRFYTDRRVSRTLGAEPEADCYPDGLVVHRRPQDESVERFSHHCVRGRHALNGLAVAVRC